MTNAQQLIADARKAGMIVKRLHSGAYLIQRADGGDVVAVWPNGWCSNQSVKRLQDQVFFRTLTARKILKMI